MAPWTVDQMPRQEGRTAVVTGANSGIGFHTALELARAGAAVVLACRNEDRGREAVERLRSEVPRAEVELAQLDLADLGSVSRFCDSQLERGEIDLLINNAGVMAVPERAATAQGFELQLGTNHLGHFALTGRLLPALKKRHGTRVVTVTSFAHMVGRIHFDDLQSERSYSKWRAYNQSKLANLLFAFELHRRLLARESEVLSVAAHPGYAHTNLQFSGPRIGGASVGSRMLGGVTRLFAQSEERGALPTLYAATAPEVIGGGFYGPALIARGHPAPNRPATRALDADVAERLWSISEELTGVTIDVPRG